MLIRYPGSKTKHVKFLAEYFPKEKFAYQESMCGGAALAFHLLETERVTQVTLADIDWGIAALWETVLRNPEELISLVREFQPSVSEFFSFRESTPSTVLGAAFRKLALHQMSYSGLGTMAGPIGGRSQTGKYKVDCRWNPKRLESNIRKAHALLNTVPTSVYHAPAMNLIDYSGWQYLDPPYVKEGPKLYEFGEFDHQALAAILQGKDKWVLSYDYTPEVLDLYSWAYVTPVDVTSHMHHRPIKDVVITP